MSHTQSKRHLLTRAYRSRTPVGTAAKNVARLVRPQVRITPPPAGVVFERDVPVPVRDGTVLRANVFRPEAPGRYPVLLSLQPYGKDQLPRARRRGTGTLTVPTWDTTGGPEHATTSEQEPPR